MTGAVENNSRNDLSASDYDFIYDGVTEIEGGNGEQFNETQLSLNECKVLIENSLNNLQLTSKRLEEKGK